MKADINYVHQQDFNQKKRDYSRGGCRECKRRKIKCDEAKPECSRCQRLYKPCTYPEVGEKVLRVSKRYLELHPEREEKKVKPLNIELYSGPKKRKKEMENDGDVNGNLKVVEKEENKTRYDPMAIPSISSMTQPFLILPQISNTRTFDNNRTPGYDYQPPLDDISPELYNQDDLDLLATDLNHIVNDIMFQSNFDKEDNLTTDLFNSLLETKQDGEISKFYGIPQEILSVTTPDEQKYLTSFYNGFAMQIMPFGYYDNYIQGYCNPVRDTLLKYACREPFLLAAILAQGAKSTYEMDAKSPTHQQAYGFYLSQCLNLLGPALSQNQEKNVKFDLISNIECILLTVLLLTSSNASINQNWRPHLKGAKDIVLKATNSKIRQSKTLILCKLWFTDFEILAGTSSKIGGTLTTDFDLDSVINFNDYEVSILKQYGIIQPNGFCLMIGYNIECVHLFRDLIKILNKKRREGEEFIASDASLYLNLISDFNKFYNTCYISQDCQLPPSYTHNEQVPNLIDIVTDGTHKSIISLMDLCQQSYCLSAIITIFTQVLNVPCQMAYIQNLNKKLLGLISYVSKYDNLPDQQIRYSFLMIQWPMMIAGMNTTDAQDRGLLRKFFEFSAELGSFSSNHLLKVLEKVWTHRDNGEDVVDDEENMDVVAY